MVYIRRRIAEWNMGKMAMFFFVALREFVIFPKFPICFPNFPNVLFFFATFFCPNKCSVLRSDANGEKTKRGKFDEKRDYRSHHSGRIIATSHDLTAKRRFLERKSPYFREISVGETLFFGQEVEDWNANISKQQMRMPKMPLRRMGHHLATPKSLCNSCRDILQ